MNSTYRKYFPYLLSLFFFILFWYFRSIKKFEGSGDLWIRDVESGIWFRKRRMLSFFAYQLTYKIMNPLFHWDARWVISFISCLAGSVFVYYLYKICARWKQGWIPFVLIMSSGMSTLFYGFIETYSMVIAASAVFFYYLLEYFENSKGAFYPAIFYSLAAGFHLQVGFYFPVLPLAWYLHGKRRAEWKPWLWGLAPCFLLIIAIKYWGIGYGDFFENIHWVTFTPQPDSPEPYTLFSAVHLREFAWFQYRIAVIAIPCLLLAPFFVKPEIWKEPLVQVLLTATLGLGVLNFFHYTVRDLTVWTVFGIFGFPSLLLTGYLLTKVRFGIEITLVLTVISLYVTIPYILDHAQLGHRGEGVIVIENMPTGAVLQLDGYKKKDNVLYHVLEGNHEIKIISPPHKMSQELILQPYQTVTVYYQP